MSPLDSKTDREVEVRQGDRTERSLQRAVAPMSGWSGRASASARRAALAYYKLCTNLYHNTLPSLAEIEKEIQ
jgi:hypothetical protein